VGVGVGMRQWTRPSFPSTDPGRAVFRANACPRNGRGPLPARRLRGPPTGDFTAPFLRVDPGRSSQNFHVSAALIRTTCIAFMAHLSSLTGTRRLAIIPKAVRADSRGDSRIGAGLIQGGARGFALCLQRCDCERIIRPGSFGPWPGGQRTSTRAGGFCRWPQSETGWIEAWRPRSAGWTARPCATGSIASTARVRRASSTTGRMPQTSPVGGATGSVRADRRGRPRSRKRWCRALAAD
jgi:hypothetical protein